ncbi:MAG: hypothetical protein M1269_09385 [Chloroflexi bacterium]|nr:hypothetical protein [Chloroflexota bacterium]
MQQTKEKLLRLLVILIAIHSFCIGFMLLFIPRQLLTAFGIPCPEMLFFPNQSGIFHVVLAMGYLLALPGKTVNLRCLAFLIIAKTIAVTFLVISGIFVAKDIIIILIGIFDGLMGLAAYIMMRITYHKSLYQAVFE